MFGKSLTPRERIRKHTRLLQKTHRDLENQVKTLRNTDKNLVSEIKKSAKEGNMEAAKIQAKDLVRTRNSITKFQTMSANIQAIELQLKVWNDILNC